MWVHAFVWHTTRTFRWRCWLDTGAGGGNYASAAFVHSVARSGKGGRSMMRSRGQGLLRGANPTNSATPPMNISGSCELLLVFILGDKVRNVVVRVVEDLRYQLIVGAAFVRKNGSVISFAVGGGFKPAPESPWVPFTLSTGASSSGTQERKAVDWKAGIQPSKPEVETASIVSRVTLEQLFAVKPSHGEEEPAETVEPSTNPSEGAVTW